MKNLYEIKNAKGMHLCYQVASSEKEAVEFAKMYGVNRAVFAEYVRKN